MLISDYLILKLYHTHMSALRFLALAMMSLLVLHACALSPEPSSVHVQDEALGNARMPAAWSSMDADPGAIEPDWLAKVADSQLEAFVAEKSRLQRRHAQLPPRAWSRRRLRQA